MDLIILSFLLLHSSFPFISGSFTPNTSYFLSCGAAAGTNISTNDSPARSFESDSNSKFYSGGESLSKPDAANPSPPLYSTARLFTSTGFYRFPLGSSGFHVVRLHFFPFSTDGYDLSAARFGVTVDQSVVLDNFSAQASSFPIIKEYFVCVDPARGKLQVTFAPASRSSFAFVNAIEIFTAPSDLFDNRSCNRTMETVYRINVGGSKVTPHSDTLWRTWIPDDDYLYDKSTSLVNSTDPRSVNYNLTGKITAEVAPPSVYSTARTLNVPEDTRNGNPSFNINVTWNFTVDAGDTYIVRSHFCDFISKPLYVFYFVLYIDQHQSKEFKSTDYTSNSLSVPFYLDADPEEPTSRNIQVSIGRSSKTEPLEANAMLNGLEIFKVIPAGTSGLSGPSGKSKFPVAVVVAATVGGIVLMILAIFALVYLRKSRRPKPQPLLPKESWTPFCRETPRENSTDRSSKYTTNGAVAATPTASPRVNLDLHISLLDIRAATKDFDDRLVVGSGGFGKVYRGVLADGTKVAVKRSMPGSKQGYPEFQTEILVLSKIRHRHLVSLIGYCDEQSERILVYEFMEKGPLRNYLYGSEKDIPCLSWKQRLEICIGAARGLHYLHTGHAHSIIHRDIKTTNILLDENYLAKVSDFGLSKLGPSVGETHITTGVKGTFGYFDPEYFKTQKLTEKSDVYSFGVMLFEVLCARPVIDRSLSMEQVNLAEWALHWQGRGQLEKIIDHRLVGKINKNSLRKFGETAEKCVADYGVDRPTFGDVLWNLEYALQLHVTELKREPHEDSANTASQITVAATTGTEAQSTSLDVGQRDNWSTMGVAVSDSSASRTVFSQLVTSEGR